MTRKEEFKGEVEKHLTGRETEPWELIYFKMQKSQLPVVVQALETAGLMLGTDKSRGSILPHIPTIMGTVDSFFVMPPLPSVLVLDSSTGMISGTPTAQPTPTAYTITTSNAGGSTTANVTIAVNKALTEFCTVFQAEKDQSFRTCPAGNWMD